MALQATTQNGNESLRLPHSCALVVARHLLNTTWSLKLRYKRYVEIRRWKKTFQMSVVIGLVLGNMKAAQGETEDVQRQTEVDLRLRRARFGIFHSGYLARA